MMHNNLNAGEPIINEFATLKGYNGVAVDSVSFNPDGNILTSVVFAPRSCKFINF